MQTDFLLPLLSAKIDELKLKINLIEQQPIPTTQCVYELVVALNDCQKYASSYLVISENAKTVADNNLHLKLMSVQNAKPQTITTEPLKIITETIVNIDNTIEKKEIEHAKLKNNIEFKTEPINISINDKFRFINELFSANATEYNIAIEQINTVNTIDEANAYFKSLKSVYDWNDDNEMFKKIIDLTHKRFV